MHLFRESIFLGVGSAGRRAGGGWGGALESFVEVGRVGVEVRKDEVEWEWSGGEIGSRNRNDGITHIEQHFITAKKEIAAYF